METRDLFLAIMFIGGSVIGFTIGLYLLIKSKDKEKLTGAWILCIGSMTPLAGLCLFLLVFIVFPSYVVIEFIPNLIMKAKGIKE